MRTELKSLFRHSGIYLIGNLLNRLGAFLLLPLYTSHLSVAEYGRLEMLYSFTAIISVIFGAALAHATLRFYYERSEQSDRNKVVVTGFVTVLALGSVGSALVFLVREPAARLLLDGADYVSALELGIAILVFELTTEVGFAYLRVRELSIFYVAISFLRLLIQVGLTLYLLGALELGVVGVLQANLASVVIVWLVVMGYTLRRCGLRVDWMWLGPMLRYSLPMGLSGIVAAVTTNVDRFLLKHFLSLEAVGLFGLAMKFALLLMFVVLEPFHRSYGPFRFSVMKQEGAPAIQAQAAHYVFVLAAIVALGIAMLTPEVLLLMATPSYLGAMYVTPILLLGVMLSGLSYCYETGVLYHKQTKLLLYNHVLGLLLKVSLNLALIPWIGIFGAAVAYVFTQAAYAAMVNRASQQFYSIPYEYAPLFRVAGLVAVCYLASLLIDYRVLWLSLPLKLTLVMALLVGLYWTDPLSRNLIRTLRRAPGPWPWSRLNGSRVARSEQP